MPTKARAAFVNGHIALSGLVACAAHLTRPRTSSTKPADDKRACQHSIGVDKGVVNCVFRTSPRVDKGIVNKSMFLLWLCDFECNSLPNIFNDAVYLLTDPVLGEAQNGPNSSGTSPSNIVNCAAQLTRSSSTTLSDEKRACQPRFELTRGVVNCGLH
jgi:hypothetical protein